VADHQERMQSKQSLVRKRLMIKVTIWRKTLKHRRTRYGKGQVNYG